MNISLVAPRSRWLPRTPEVVAWLMPVAVLVTVGGLAAVQRDPAAVAETRFLALLAAAVVAAIAATVARSARSASAPELGWTAVLATAAIWIAYHGPPRGAVVASLLVAGVAVAAGRVWLDPRTRERPAGGLGPGVTVPVAVGLQLLTRPDLLLPPLLEPRALFELLVLPAAAGCATTVLASRFDRRRVLPAVAAVVVTAPGWRGDATVGLVALAAGVLFADPRRSTAVRGLAAVALLLLPLWQPTLGTLFAVGGLSLATRGWSSWLVPVAAAGVAAMSPARSFAPEVWLAGVALVPAVVVAPAGGRWRAFHGVVLAAAVAGAGGGPELLGPGLALAALGLPVAGSAAALQRLWAAVLVLGTVLLAGYPWLRQEPRRDLLELLGLGDPVVAVAFAVAAVAGVGLLLDRLPARLRPRPAVVAALLLGFALLRSLTPTSVLLESYHAAALGADSPHWSREVPPGPVSEVVIDTNLIRGVGLRPGRPVAVVRLRDPEGRILGSWRLRAGVDTAEWAAARPDVAARPGFAAPPHWVSQVATGGTFFARRFRSRFAVEAPADASKVSASKVTVHLAPHLPPEVRVMIYRVELRR